MRRILLILAAWPFALAAQAQSPQPAPANDLFPAALFEPLPEPRTPDSDLAIVFWCDWHDPAGTLRHQVYDRRKGEYTPAVGDWLKTIRRDFPDYVASVRYVDVGQRNVAEVVRETVADYRDTLQDAAQKVRRANLSRRLNAFSRAEAQKRPTTRPLTQIGPFRPLGASDMMARPVYPFPFPFPYPRPHP